MTRRLAAMVVGCLTLAGCSALPQGPDPLPSTFIPDVEASAAPDADVVGGFTVAEREALRVRVRTCESYMTGTAFAIDETHAITNRHVVEGATDITVTGYDGRSYTVKKSVLARNDDLALLTIEETFPNIATLAEAEPSHGDELTIAGYPLGEALVVRSGPFTRDVTDTVGTSDDMVYEIRVESHPGNSGSGVTNEDGKIVGVLYASNDVDTSYAVSLPTLNNFLDNLDDAQRNSAECESQG
ncbi:S1 family peptidase [Demequina sp.]|uniref:S1 family peptidase n=1 Tax=Demequina sp. TaxID=2050685 RepID=UPI003D0E1C52